MATFTLIDEIRSHAVDAVVRGDAVRVPPGAVARALGKRAEGARPYIERAAPRHPALIDSEHVVADLFNVINVPTMIWIDERGRIVRPNDVQFGTDLFVALTNRPSAPFLAAVRAWVLEGKGVLGPEEIRAHEPLPTAEQQAARSEFR